MSPGKSNMIRSACRFVEVLLFFVISVVGLNLFAKTTSLNSKTKVKSLTGGPVAPRELSAPDIHRDFNRLYSFFHSPHQQRTSSLSNHSQAHVFMGMPHHLSHSLSYCSHNQNNPLRPSFLHKPGNLFQQNPVLLI